MSGLNRLINSDLTVKKLKGKALVAAVGKEFSPEAILKRNSGVNKGDPDGDGQPMPRHHEPK